MKKSKALTWIFMCIFMCMLVQACQPLDNREQDSDAIKLLLEEIYPVNVKSGNAQQYASIFTDDARWMPPQAADKTGKTAIAEGMDDLFSKLSLASSITTQEINIVNERFAYVVGDMALQVHPKDGSSASNRQLRVLWLLSKDSGVWKISRQIWNSKS